MSSTWTARSCRTSPSTGTGTRRPFPPPATSSWQRTPTCYAQPCSTTSPPEARTGTKVFAPTKASKRQIEVHDKTGTRYGNQGTTVFAGAANRYTDAYALRTTDGGALILFSHTHTQTDAVAHSGLQINPGKDDRAWLHDVPRTSITYTFVCNDAAIVPAKAEQPRLIGYTCARTDASGPPVAS
ncbi:hypothetical protein ACWGJ6_16595 [Streptomyces canus]